MSHRLTNVPTSNYNKHGGWQNGFHKYLHLASAYAWIAASWVSHTIIKVARAPIDQRIQGFLNDSVFQFPTADSAKNVPILKDEHFTGTVAWCRTTGFNYGAQCDRFMCCFELSEFLIDRGHNLLYACQHILDA
jgi:hypothetical protein